ncbi:ribonuclease P protein subunit p40-like [Sycon ciliatum]|uniref:ribonuclease P protein subunit p40-like n=1 Tax=Sycon ciliatum TaxID=27933 RepID=UPI0031F6BA8D|eukprot:scpid70458/ scgid8195/ Ribonuclease P protein subunit p40
MATKLPSFRSQLVFENRRDEQLSAARNKLVTEHPFNCAAEAFIPGPMSALERIQNQLPDDAKYFKAEVPVANFLRVDFIANHLKKGCLHGVSTGCGVDREDCVALMPNGDLILSLTKDTYLELGLEGKSSTVQPGARHIVEVNLTAAHCHPDKKYYKRVLWCLTDRLQLVFPFVLAYSNPGDVNAERLSQDLGVPCQPCDVKRTQRSWYHLATPRLNQDVLAYAATQTHGQATDSTEVAATAGDPPSSGATPDRAVADQTVDASVTEDDVIHAAVEFHDWLGAMLCGIKLDERACSSAASSMGALANSVHTNECASVRWTGCLSSESVSSTLGALRQLVSDGNLPWASLCVWGFHDSPVSWRRVEHGYRQSADNQYTVLLLPRGQYWVLATSPP